jgi:phosphopantothenoylcysteine decarboxylase/phosphopantothenate--cysteine ligase
MVLQGKKIILGISGSIAAYKAAVLSRLFVKAGAEVKVIMTAGAKDFIQPLTLATLTKYPVYSEFINNESGEWNNHVELGLWADLMVIAPATANTIAKMANGICDNLLLATYLSARCPIMVAPAMDLDMWLHAATQNNLNKITQYGNLIVEPATGELASGLNGKGRMAEPEDIYSAVEQFFSKQHLLSKKKVLITAGPTIEPIDPVRFISNHSTGKMGYAIAEAMANYGAEVVLVSGPTQCKALHKNIKVFPVTTAEQMAHACMQYFKETDIAVLSAAVADYSPATVSNTKIKKQHGDAITITLKKTTDILKSLGQIKNNKQILVGFALETNNEIEHAKQKLVQKNADIIVLNSLNDAGAGFALDTNKITVLHKNGKQHAYELKDKKQVAVDIVNEIINVLNAKV